LSIDSETIFFALVVAGAVLFGGRAVARAVLRRQRRRVARNLGLQVGVDEEELRRGTDVGAYVTIADATGLEGVEVGLVCTESCDEEETSYTTRRTRTQRVTRKAVAHEAWTSVAASAGVQRARLAIPAEAPFSHDGSCLAFKWEVVARGHRHNRVDASPARDRGSPVSPRLELELERNRYEPGDTIRGSIVVVEGGRSRSLEVWLEYNEKTEDYSDVATRITSPFRHEGELAAGESFDFEVALPRDAAPNYRSEHGELFWELNVKSDELGRDTSVRRRLEVVTRLD
jgi:hypothetical protein